MEHRWSHEPLEESLRGARRLSIDVADRLARAGWDELAALAGIPGRRWRTHHPLGDEQPLIAMVDGRAAYDLAAWARFVSLVPGAVALPGRTAAAHGVDRTELAPPSPRPWRLLDLLRARRRRRHLRRAERSVDADVELFASRLDAAVTRAMAAGDDGTPLAQLPPYALAARFEELLALEGVWGAPALVDLQCGQAMAQLVERLDPDGSDPLAAAILAARLASGGGPQLGSHLEAFEELAALPATERDAALDAWLDGRAGWHALRELVLEAPPLRQERAVVEAWLDAPPRAATPEQAPDLQPDRDLRDAIGRARRLSALRERVGHERPVLHAGLRAIVHALAARLAADGALPTADRAFDLGVAQLLAVARGGSVPAPGRPTAIRTSVQPVDTATPSDVVRGLPASVGTATGPVLALDAPTGDAVPSGAILVCRATDPGWMPLLLRCAGLVTERGGPLSHAAIVARELGIPAVVGAPGALAAARVASSVTVDGSRGVATFDGSPCAT